VVGPGYQPQHLLPAARERSEPSRAGVSDCRTRGGARPAAVADCGAAREPRQDRRGKRGDRGGAELSAGSLGLFDITLRNTARSCSLAFFHQQRRWSKGCLCPFQKLLPLFLCHLEPEPLRLLEWGEFLSEACLNGCRIGGNLARDYPVREVWPIPAQTGECVGGGHPS
jgi:hypothetical protein